MSRSMRWGGVLLGFANRAGEITEDAAALGRAATFFGVGTGQAGTAVHVGAPAGGDVRAPSGAPVGGAAHGGASGGGIVGAAGVGIVGAQTSTAAPVEGAAGG